MCASPLWSAPDPCDDPSKHRAKDGKCDQWDGPSHHRGDQWRRAGTQIPEQRPNSFALQAPEGQKEQRRHKQSRQKSGDSDSLWSGHAQLIAIGQAGAAPPTCLLHLLPSLNGVVPPATESIGSNDVSTTLTTLSSTSRRTTSTTTRSGKLEY